MTSTPEHDDTHAAADPRLIEAHDLALAALHEITPASTVGAPAGYTVEEAGVVSLRFATTMEGYPGWFWTVSLAVVEDSEPTVLEAELLPGEGALLAPDWVPWAERLAEYQAAQAALAAEQGVAEASDGDDEDGDDLDDLDDMDASDFDEDGSPILHAGDVDGVDIDELDEDAVEDESDEDDSDDDEDASDEEDASDDRADEDDDTDE